MEFVGLVVHCGPGAGVTYGRVLQENGSGQSNGQCPSLLKAVAKLRQAIDDEITSLAEKENQVMEHAQTTKQKLSAVCVRKGIVNIVNVEY